jgi:hypothetical protein
MGITMRIDVPLLKATLHIMLEFLMECVSKT